MIKNFKDFLLEKTSLFKLGVPQDVVSSIEKDFHLDPNTNWTTIKFKKEIEDLVDTKDTFLLIELDPIVLKVFTKYHHKYFVDRYRYDEEGWGSWEKEERVKVSKTQFIEEINYDNLKFYTLDDFEYKSYDERELNRRINEIEVFRFHFKLEFREKFNSILRKMYGRNAQKIADTIVQNLSKVSTLGLSPEQIKDVLEQNIEQSKKAEYMKIKATDEDPMKLKNEIPQPNSLVIFEEYLISFEDEISNEKDEYLNIKDICDLYTKDKVFTAFMYYLYSGKLMEL